MDYIAGHLQYRIPLTIRSQISSRETTQEVVVELTNKHQLIDFWVHT